MLRPTHCLLIVALLASGLPAQTTDSIALRLMVGQQQAAAVLPAILRAAAPAGLADALTEVERQSLGTPLAVYANNPGADAHSESFVDAARRILAGGTTARQTPDAASAALEASAATLLAIARAAEATPAPARGPQFATTLEELHVRALLARFHARRILAAVHYNLFLRGRRLAELVAATYGEKDAVIVWRELVARHPQHALADAWRAELKKLEISLKELEDQCCPPDDAILREKVWEPAKRVAAQSR